MSKEVNYNAEFKAGDKIRVVEAFNFADRFYSEVGDIWNVLDADEYFTAIQRGEMMFWHNNSDVNRIFEMA